MRIEVNGTPTEVATLPTDGTPEEAGDGTARKARRMKADQVARKDSLILYKFEAMLTWAEMMNINRRVEDDDLDTAKKAAEDHEEVVLGQQVLDKHQKGL